MSYTKLIQCIAGLMVGLVLLAVFYTLTTKKGQNESPELNPHFLYESVLKDLEIEKFRCFQITSVNPHHRAYEGRYYVRKHFNCLNAAYSNTYTGNIHVMKDTVKIDWENLDFELPPQIVELVTDLPIAYLSYSIDSKFTMMLSETNLVFLKSPKDEHLEPEYTHLGNGWYYYYH